jgi:hypothetical protein
MTLSAVGQTYCIPSHTAGSCGVDEYIANVTIATLNNSSACDPLPHYEDFTALAPTLLPPSSVNPITVTIGTFWSGDEVDVYCDWDGNGILNDPGEHTQLFTSGGSSTGTITVPTSPVPLTRMRVMLRYFGAPDPCLINGGFGNTEDYTILTGGTPNCWLLFSSPFGPGSIQMDNTPCPPVAGASYINAITLAAGTYPAGWFFGLDISFGQLLNEFNTGYPFTGTLDGSGASAFGLASGVPSGLQLWAVSVQFAPGFGAFLYNRPAVTYTVP